MAGAGAVPRAGWERRLALPAALLVLTALALALRLYGLGAQSLWLDEGSTWAEVTGRTGKGWAALLGELLSPSAAYPLYHLLLRAWVGLAGDSEWALRLPSAVAGALAVPALLLAAVSLRRLRHGSGAPAWSAWDAAAPLLLLASPIALWFAQEAKTYSLVLLVEALKLWALSAALRHTRERAEADAPPRRWWRSPWTAYVTLALLSMLVHRLALLTVAAAGVALALSWPWQRGQTTARVLGGLAALGIGSAAVAGTIAAGRGDTASGALNSLGSLQALWLTLVRFTVDRSPGDIDGYLGIPVWGWALPALLLFTWQTARLAREAAHGEPAAVLLLCTLLLPAGLYLLAEARIGRFEPRYLLVSYPAWLLILGWNLRAGRPWNLALPVLAALALAAALGSLWQPKVGLFSGDPVKEQWRDAVRELARRAHPDDLLVVHPYYAAPLYEYYRTRVTRGALPDATVFGLFAEGEFCGLRLDAASDRQVRECLRREFETRLQAAADGRLRSLLLIAPEHARTVDPPNPQYPQDRFGWVGLRYQYAELNRAWPCGSAGFVGVEVLCMSFPERSGSGTIPQPETPHSVIFGEEVALLGYTLKPARADGAFVAGGTVPITLFWTAVAPPQRDYTMFLHLCQACDRPPAASQDGPPLEGYVPTSWWEVEQPPEVIHDERVIPLDAALPPGQYRLLLGMYLPENPAAEARIPVTGPGLPPGARIVEIGTVEIVAATRGR